jgi:DNA repair photolyase
MDEPESPPPPLPPTASVRGRGTPANPRNRFEQAGVVPDWEQLPADEVAEPRRKETLFLPDNSQSILSKNQSPDLPFRYSLNPYRGCEHGCVYCYARPTHEYLGFSAGLDFETKIMVKEKAPALLADALSDPRWVPEHLTMSGVTDCYQPAEREHGITRRCLQVLADFRNPVGIVSKNALVARDVDILSEMAQWRGVIVMISLTSLDPELARRMEPRTASPRQRLETVSRLAAAGVPVGVNLAPMIPGLNDTEMADLVGAAVKAGASFAHYMVLRLPYGVKDLFTTWLDREFPGKKARIIERLNDLRGGPGKLNDPRFGTRFTGEGQWTDTFTGMFALACRKAGLREIPHELNTAEFRVPGRATQLGFEGLG